MIIRDYIACDTCSQVHMVRIGMGQNEIHEHTFACENCGEPIKIALVTDYINISAHVDCIKNATRVDYTEDDVPVVNLDPHFLIPKEQQGDSSSFFRIEQYRDILKKSAYIKNRENSEAPKKELLEARPWRKPDYEDEWQRLRKAWGLEKRDKPKLSLPILKSASDHFYSNDSLNSVADWLWRFNYFLCGEGYSNKRTNILNTLRSLKLNKNEGLGKYYYSSQKIKERGDRYFDIYKDFFDSYSEFSQVYLYTLHEIPIDGMAQATSTHFDQTKMFYGKAYEHFTHFIELFALLNNSLQGRKFDEFQQLSLKEYLKLDKSAKAGPFSTNIDFMSVCEEYDVQLRNASHHGTFSFDESRQQIKYRTGKGALGPEVTITYVEYLQKCLSIFMQISVLMTIELIIASAIKVKFI